MTMQTKDFAIFILTHGRPADVKTYKSLRRHGYSGRIVLLIDNEDKTADQYREAYGDQVEVFDKTSMAGTVDTCDNFESRKTIVYARNASFEVAERLGLKFFVQMDDDYTSFTHRMDGAGRYVTDSIRDLDSVFDVMIRYMMRTPSLSIAMAQGGDFIGGRDNSMRRIPGRKAMNSFFCSTDRRFRFVARANDDVTTYTTLSARGGLFMTIKFVSLAQVQTQKTGGGMTEVYQDHGTYVKSFYSVIAQPSSVKVRMMGAHNRRIHHCISWVNTTPYIVPESFKKK